MFSKKEKRSSLKLRVIFRPKSKIQRFFCPKSGVLQKKRSSPKLRLIFRPISQIQTFEGGCIRMGGLFSIFHNKSASKSQKTCDFAYFTSQWVGLEPPRPPPPLATLLIDDQMLKHATGIKYYECNGYQKIPGLVAKFFSSSRPGYAYPLFKTHKLTPDALSNVSVFDIPISLLQSACNITTSKITAFLESIFQPISIKFCQFKISEYCRDSKQYVHEVAEWKTTVDHNSNNDNLYIVGDDVRALYPTISRSLVEKALSYVLTHFHTTQKLLLKFSWIWHYFA